MVNFVDYYYGPELEEEINKELVRLTGKSYMGESRAAVLNVILELLRKVPSNDSL